MVEVRIRENREFDAPPLSLIYIAVYENPITISDSKLNQTTTYINEKHMTFYYSISSFLLIYDKIIIVKHMVLYDADKKKEEKKTDLS